MLTILMGAQSLGLFAVSGNGGIALSQISSHYLGRAGLMILAATITFACLKTSIGLVTSCSETFEKMFPGRLSYKAWAVLFTAFSFLISNAGLSTIIRYSVPVLMLIYPPAIALILLALFGKRSARFMAASRCKVVCSGAGSALKKSNREAHQVHTVTQK